MARLATQNDGRFAKYQGRVPPDSTTLGDGVEGCIPDRDSAPVRTIFDNVKENSRVGSKFYE